MIHTQSSTLDDNDEVEYIQMHLYSTSLSPSRTPSYRWVRFEVCRPGDGRLPHSLPEDDASICFEAFQRQQGYEDAGPPELGPRSWAPGAGSTELGLIGEPHPALHHT